MMIGRTKNLQIDNYPRDDEAVERPVVNDDEVNTNTLRSSDNDYNKTNCTRKSSRKARRKSKLDLTNGANYGEKVIQQYKAAFAPT